MYQFCFLGLYINNNLTWDTHIKYISLKISKIILMINRLKHIYPQHILHNIYNTLILPHLNYCVNIWGLNCTSLYLLQKKAMRTITCSWYRAHTDPIFKALHVLKIHDIYRYSRQINLITLFREKSRGCQLYPIRNPQYHLLDYNWKLTPSMDTLCTLKYISEQL